VKEGLYYFLTPLLQTFVSILFWAGTMLGWQNKIGPNYQEKTMIEQSLLLKLSSPGIADSTTSQLRQEYQAYQSLFQAQPSSIQNYLETQAASLVEALLQGSCRVRFALPEQVICLPSAQGLLNPQGVPVDLRQQTAGVFLGRFSRTSLRTVLCQHLAELEGSSNQAVSVSVGLLRYAIATHMVYKVLPIGNSVVYTRGEDDEIPNLPVDGGVLPESAIIVRADTDGADGSEEKRDELAVPYVEAVRRFYLPQWVAFDGEGHLLVSSVSEAEAMIASMQRYLTILHSAVVIAPYMIADELYQQKRYGMLGQLVNQGRALALYQFKEIIQTIRRRVAEHKLDRGLRLSLPYFDDHRLVIETYDFMVTPAGWVMFIPAFAVLAAREEQSKVARDTHLSYATRKHVLAELKTLERTFLR
jgi:hypothetical protein